jgi:CheY-like chemotaxis protein
VRVLVVDDEDDLRTVASMFLEMRGHDAIVAGSAAEAFERIAADSPDVVLLDLRMPGMDGWEVLERLERSRPCRSSSCPRTPTRRAPTARWSSAAGATSPSPSPAPS